MGNGVAPGGLNALSIYLPGKRREEREETEEKRKGEEKRRGAMG